MHQIEIDRLVAEDAAYTKWAEEHSEQIEAESMAEWVATLCEGHESLRGDMMGATEFCDGTCVPLSERNADAYAAHIEDMLPDWA